MILYAMLTAVFSLGVNVAALAAYWWWMGRQKAMLAPLPTPPPMPPEITAAVHESCAAVGLPREQLGPDYDLMRAGKLYDVLRLASQALGKDHELRTVQDVCDWLLDAPLKD